MHLSINYVMPVTENIKKFKNILDEAQKARLEDLSTWYSFFNMREDPFSTQIQQGDIDYFVNQEEIIKSIIFDLGVSKRGISIVELLVGPSGTGKSSLLLYLDSVMKHLANEDPKYLFSGEVSPVDKLLQDEESDELDEDERGERWIRLSNKKFDYFFFDDAGPPQVTRMMQYFVKPKLKLFVVKPQHVLEIQNNLNGNPNIFYIKQLNFQEIKEMLGKRMKKALVDTNSKFTVDDIFEENALKSLVKFCFGIPKLILQGASYSLQFLRQHNMESRKEIGKLKINEETITLACKRIKCYQAYHHYRNIGEHKINILRWVIENEKTPTEISSEIQKDRTTVSRHLNELKDLELVEQRSKGRESYYRATEPVRILTEIDSLPKGVWNFD